MTIVITQRKILKGVNVKEALALSKKLRINKQEFANTLGVSSKALQKKSADAKQSLDKNISERCLNISILVDFVADFFGNEDAAITWLHTENRGLGYVTPFSLCDTFYGMQRVENAIIKLKHGMTA